jgi:hypothetical protein
MADIALLMTEQFEKGAKRGAPHNADGGDLAAVEKVWRSWAESAAAGVRLNFAVRLREVQPKTGLGLAAFDGFFSA